jgi:hypothetical protein
LTLIYTIRKVQENHDGLELKGTHQVLVCADGFNVRSKYKCHKEKPRSSVRV